MEKVNSEKGEFVRNNRSLIKKIEKSKRIIADVFDKFKCDDLRIAWTGGKDSTIMLWLFRSVCKEKNIEIPKAMFIDEGAVFDEIWDLVYRVKQQWQIMVDVVKNEDVSKHVTNIGELVKVEELNERNRYEIGKLGYKEQYFSFEPDSLVCNHLMKTVAMNVYLGNNNIKALATAIRWDEQEARIEEDYFSKRQTPDHTRIHPILHFTERDIWDCIHKYELPFCNLYRIGYRSLGAKNSTDKHSDQPAWEQDLENTYERAGRGQDKEKVMEQLRSLGYM